MHWGIWLPWCLFVVAPTKHDHDLVDKLLNTLFGPKPIILLFGFTLLEFCLQHFLPMLCAHATNIKKTLALGQTLLHGKTSSIKISYYSSLIKCMWMWSQHEIEHALMKINLLCKTNIVCAKTWCATKNDLPYYLVLQQNMHYNKQVINLYVDLGKSNLNTLISSWALLTMITLSI